MSWFGWAKRTARDTGRTEVPTEAPATPPSASAPSAQPPAVDDPHRRGVDAIRAGDFVRARDAFLAAITAQPGVASNRVDLAFVLQELGEADEARAQLEQAVALDPASFDAHHMLGLAMAEAGDDDCAATHFTAASTLDPASADAFSRLALARRAQHRSDEAAAAIEQALRIRPDDPELHNVAGLVFQAAGRGDDAIASFTTAAALRPDAAGFHANLGLAFQEQARFEAAARAYRQAIAIAPTAEMFNHLGMALARLGANDDALEQYEAALAIAPANLNVQSNRAGLYTDAGRHVDAIDAFRQVLAIDPLHKGALSGLLYNLSVDDRCDPLQYLNEARRFDAGAAAARPLPARPRRDGEPLRVGFVSGDLLDHPVAYFLEGVLQHIDARRIEAFAYPTVARTDAVTARIRPLFKAWRVLKGLPDEVAAAHIRADGIDVLIDLAGHTADGRPGIFVGRAAPVQVAWLGFFASTGIAAIDYILADALCVPPGHEFMFSERVWRLPDTRLCFTPPADPARFPLTSLPALRNGAITFASFQRWTKITDDVIALWTQALQAVPGSRLRLQSMHSGRAAQVDAMTARFAHAGLDPARLVLRGPAPRERYLNAYAEVDIVLDSFPYTGGTTTCEALWMGVPTLTLTGATMIARQGVAMLTTAGVPEWVASDKADFVARAARFAADTEALAGLRAELRARVTASPLFDTATFAGHLESTLVDIWNDARSRRASVPEGNPG